ncbi:PTS sugar transporter subunit IIA [Lentilactobacillus sp. G22-6]|uniref:BglG family transcription antiterminator n=1 Tax=Lentilactobacillus dabitei TaxID=2831523 RepID=UPI001C254991|nr:PTS sugar transporter subunit IIA [Lentilactobacillus dabitei]MBU9788447.1 PTS sugar transporter subunit IIA [Lentilactobacillus dabitei]
MIKFSKYKHGNELLNILEESDSFIPATDLMDKLHLSRRSVFYLINKVNKELDGHELFGITNIQNMGYYLPEETAKELQTVREAPVFNGLTLAQRTLIIPFILISRNYSSLSYLSSYLSVSKNTIIRDLSSVEDTLKKQQLEIVNTNKGKTVKGEELDKRRWVYENSDDLIQIYEQQTKVTINPVVPKQLELLEKITGNSLTDDAKVMLKCYLTWYLKRVKNPSMNLVDKNPDPHFSLAFTWANSLLQDSGVHNRSEAEYLTRIVNSRQFSFVNWDDPLIQTLKPITNSIIQRFNEVAGVSINPNENSLVSNLTVHLLSTYYRAKFNINYRHPSLDQIKVSYQETFDLTRIAVQPFEAFLKKKISDDEVALIALYFGGVLRNAYSTVSSSGQVLVVCSSGIGTSQLLLRKLKTTYPTVNFSGPMNVIQYENSTLDKVQLVISTIHLHPKKEIPIIHVSALPSDTEWNTINQALVRTNLIADDTIPQINVGTLMDIISTYSRIVDPDGLKDALKTYISRASHKDQIIKNNTEDSTVLFPNDVQLIDQNADWGQAIKYSMAPLQKDGQIEPKYVNKIITLAKKHGPYMALGNGIMLAHASPNDGVNKLGISFTMFKQPFDLVDPSKKIKLIIGLAPIDEQRHLSYLGLLMKKLQDKKWLDNLYEASSETELIKILKQSDLLETANK